MIKFLHSMIRTSDPQKSIEFYTQGLGLKLIKRYDNEAAKFSLYFIGEQEDGPMVELTHNWDDRTYSGGDNFGHLAYQTNDIYALCSHLQGMGVTILRPPRDGHMAFVKDPNGISIELLQSGDSLPAQEPWVSMENTGTW